jgi:glycosyltransferase involved in cell wall biosynthesis
MRVVFVVPTVRLSGGMRVVSIYARGLAERGHSVTIAVRHYGKPGIRDHLRSLLDSLRRRKSTTAVRDHPIDFGTVSVVEVPSSRPLRDDDLPDADAIVATWWETAEAIKSLGAAKGHKAYLIQHHEMFDYLPGDRVASTYRQPMLHIVVSRWLDEIMRQQYASRNVVLIPNAVDCRQFYPEQRVKQAQPTVGFMYDSYAAWKGLALMLKAISLAGDRIENLRVVAFGHALPDPNFPLPEGGRYFQSPPQQQLRPIYSSCDAWLFGSSVEGFGLPILESMACGTPVIGTPAGAAPELLAEGRGMLVPHGDPQAMADALIQICGQPDSQWQSQSQRAARFAATCSWDASVGLLEATLLKLAAKQS